jgi:hypothetical protein
MTERQGDDPPARDATDEKVRWAAEQAGWQGAALALEAFADRLEGATLDAESPDYVAGAVEAFRLAAGLAREQARAIREEKLGGV